MKLSATPKGPNHMIESTRASMPTLRTVSLLAAALCVTTQAALAQEKSQCQFTLVAQLPLSYSGPSLEVTTSGTINGTAATMLVDTGADNIYLTRTGTDRRGLRVDRTGASGRGIGGSFNIMTSTVREIALGPIRTGKLDLEVIGNTGYTPSYDVVLGGRFLFQTDVEIALPDKRLNFFKASGCADEYLGYWKEGAVDLPFRYDQRVHPTPTFTVELNGQKMSAMIDSGASISLVNVEAATRAGFRPDAPGVSRAGDIVGVGKSMASKWNAPFDTLKVGDETIRAVHLGVVDSREVEEDIVLGADFLRTHRVLFSMSQQKLYVSYAGGDVFGQSNEGVTWIEHEANAGNPDAEYVLAQAYARGGSREAARLFLDKATAHGQPQANLWTGRQLLAQGKFADAATHIKLALERLPAERYGALSLYLARLQQGQADEAKRELGAAFERDEADEWPRAIADFYLGRIDADTLLSRATLPAQQAKSRTCTAYMYIGELHKAQGRTAQADAARSNYSANCSHAAQAAPGA